MSRHRLRKAWRKAIFILIASALVFVSSAQHFVVAQSLASTDSSHANHSQVADMNGMAGHAHHQSGDEEKGGELKKQAQDDAQEPQDGSCCELSCVTFAVIATAAIEIASPVGQNHAAAVFDNMAGYVVFDLMRPPRI
jgi:hypothetical protein